LVDIIRAKDWSCSMFIEAFITHELTSAYLELICSLSLLECLVAHQTMNCLMLADFLPPLQSGFRRGHSTETAILLSDILQAVDHGDLAALILLDLSSAFDTVDHSILLEQLQQTFGIADTATVN